MNADLGFFQSGDLMVIFQLQAKYYRKGLQKQGAYHQAHGDHVQRQEKVFHGDRFGETLGLWVFLNRGAGFRFPVNSAANDQSQADTAVYGGDNDITAQIGVQAAQENTQKHHGRDKPVKRLRKNMVNFQRGFQVEYAGLVLPGGFRQNKMPFGGPNDEACDHGNPQGHFGGVLFIDGDLVKVDSPVYQKNANKTPQNAGDVYQAVFIQNVLQVQTFP